MIRLLHVISTMDPKTGGVCQAVRTLISSLRRHNVTSEVVCLDAANAHFIKHDSFLIHPIGQGISPWFYNKSLLGWLTQNLELFDAIIVHGMWLYPSYAVRKARNYLRHNGRGAKMQKLFIMPHGMLDPYFQIAGSRRLKAIRNDIYWRLIESRNINEADGLLFTTQEESLLASTTFKNYRPSKSLVIGLGVEDPPKFSNSMYKSFLEKCPLNHKNPYILFLGRIDKKKGIELLIEAYKQIVENLETNSNGKTTTDLPALIIAGPGLETKYGQDLIKKVNKLDILGSLIHFPGMLTGDAKWGAIYGCSAFILFSHQENYGIAVVEALACRKAVLISNKINIWREIANDGAGFVGDTNVQEVKEKILIWLGLNDEDKLSLGSLARRAYEKHFLPDEAATRLLLAIAD